MGIKLNLIDIDTVCEKLPEVKSHKIYENGKFSKTGLFSQQIFGPVQSYRCACGKFNGRKYRSKICPYCSVKVENSVVRRKYFGKINLPFEILNPIFYFLILKVKLSSKHIINNLLTYKDEYYLDKDNNLISANLLKRQNTPIDSTYRLLSGLDGCVEYIKLILKQKQTDTSIFIENNIKYLTIKNILVLPPDDRPLLRNNSDINFCDEINKLYKYILVKSSQMKDLNIEYTKDDEIYKNTFKFLQEHVLNLYKYIFDKLSKKTGLIRSNILGKRVDFSGRAVISPNPEILLDECKIPYKMLLEIYKPHLTKYLVSRRVGKRYNVLSKYIDECILNGDPSLFKYVEDFCTDKVCILNRQPSLHRLSILGFKIKPHLGNTIQIHPLVCNPLNADFDGDCITGKITLVINGVKVTLSMEQISKNENFKKYAKKINKHGTIIEKYKPINNDIYIQSISPDTGDIDLKQILDYSIHKNIEMYNIHDIKNRFEDIHSSSNHSLIVYNEETDSIEKISPLKLLENPNGKYLIQRK